MIYLVKKPIKAFFCFVFTLFAAYANAQVSLLQNSIDKMEGYKNFSYQYCYRQKEYTSDTLVIQGRYIFSKAPDDKVFGYLFSMDDLGTNGKSLNTITYDGQNFIALNPKDSTYTIREPNPSAMLGSLLSYLKLLKGLAEKKPSQIAGDTTIDAMTCSHVILNTYDSIINKEHYYTRIHIFIDKSTGILRRIIGKSRNINTGDGVTNFYTEFNYFNYRFNQDHIDIAAMAIPKGFHPLQEQPEEALALLAPGQLAPDWTLYDADGKKMSLKEIKGKVILLDFFFIGCGGCMASLKPLNKLHEKYNGRNVAIISIDERDSRKSVAEFGNNYHIKYPIYTNAADVIKSYHVEAFPTFYFIDKEGKIAGVFKGYSDDFEEKAISIIDGLLGPNGTGHK